MKKFKGSSKQSNKGLYIVGTLALLLLFLTVGMILLKVNHINPEATANNIAAGGSGIAVTKCTSVCPDDLGWNGTITVENGLNTTGTETYATTMYFFDAENGDLKTSGSYGTGAGMATKLQCGREYEIQIISTSGAAGDSAKITAAPSKALIGDNKVKYTACGSGEALVFKSEQHGLPEVRVFDVINDGFCYETTDRASPDAMDYDTTDGIVYFGTTVNSSIAVGTNGELHVKEYVRANVEDENVNDLGMWVLVDAATTVWQKPVVKINGAVAEEASGQLNADERLAYNDYEYVYFVPVNTIITKNKELEFDMSMFALSGVDPSGANNVSIDYSPVGRYASQINTNVLKVGAVDDSSSRTQIHTLHDTTISVS